MFDFDSEVEPMLNVLCDKTLEQARMEVLEEEELRIMKWQQKEYEEIRNAELIEAQRFEAAEERVKQEISRRAVQQKARKTDRKLAHEKHVARVTAKKYLTGIRERALQCLHDQGLMQPSITCELSEDVLPWLIEKTKLFLDDGVEAIGMSDSIIDDGIFSIKRDHGQTLRIKDAEREDRARAKLDEERNTDKRRHDRKIARETRAKQQAKAKIEQEIKKIMIEKSGVVVNGVVNDMLLDIHGCYEKGKTFLGALGGQIQQWYYVVSAILRIYNGPTELLDYYNRKRSNPTSDEANKALTARELMMEQFFTPFLVIAIKELKCETLQLMASPQMMKIIETLKC